MSTGRGLAVVLGLGLHGGGVGVARHLHQLGYALRVLDRRDAETLRSSLDQLADLRVDIRLGEHRATDLDGCTLLIPNPAIAQDHPLLVEARRRNIAIRGEIDLLIDACNLRCIAVTGTNGKSTVSSWIAFLLERCGVPVRLGGNLGISLLGTVASLDPATWLVLEVSSFQLEALQPSRPWPDVAVWTNLSPDHLDRHGDLQGYAQAKDGLLRHQASHQVAILNGLDPVLSSTERPAKGRRIWIGAAPANARARYREAADGTLFWQPSPGEQPGVETALGDLRSLPLRGAFQGMNALMALAAVEVAGVDPIRAAQELSAFSGVVHRLRELGRIGDRYWIDNGVSTTPTSTLSALEDTTGRPLYWIGGGKTKHLPLGELATAAATRCAEVFAFGAAAEELHRAVAEAGGHARRFADLASAVRAAATETPPGATILFSPAFASFDAYPHFRVRAEEFLRLLGVESTS